MPLIGAEAQISEAERVQSSADYQRKQQQENGGVSPIAFDDLGESRFSNENKLTSESENINFDDWSKTKFKITPDGDRVVTNVDQFGNRDWAGLDKNMRERKVATGLNTYPGKEGWVVYKPRNPNENKKMYESIDGGKMTLLESIDPKLAEKSIFYTGKETGISSRYAFNESRRKYSEANYPRENLNPRTALTKNLDRFLDVVEQHRDRKKGTFNQEGVKEYLKKGYDFHISEIKKDGLTITYLDIYHEDAKNSGTGKIRVRLDGINGSGRIAANPTEVSLVYDTEGKVSSKVRVEDYGVVAGLLRGENKMASAQASAQGGEVPKPTADEGDPDAPRPKSVEANNNGEIVLDESRRATFIIFRERIQTQLTEKLSNISLVMQLVEGNGLSQTDYFVRLREQQDALKSIDALLSQTGTISEEQIRETTINAIRGLGFSAEDARTAVTGEKVEPMQEKQNPVERTSNREKAKKEPPEVLVFRVTDLSSKEELAGILGKNPDTKTMEAIWQDYLLKKQKGEIKNLADLRKLNRVGNAAMDKVKTKYGDLNIRTWLDTDTMLSRASGNNQISIRAVAKALEQRINGAEDLTTEALARIKQAAVAYATTPVSQN